MVAVLLLLVILLLLFVVILLVTKGPELNISGNKLEVNLFKFTNSFNEKRKDKRK
jgi:hypothetical protein